MRLPKTVDQYARDPQAGAFSVVKRLSPRDWVSGLRNAHYDVVVPAGDAESDGTPGTEYLKALSRSWLNASRKQLGCASDFSVNRRIVDQEMRRLVDRRAYCIHGFGNRIG